MEISKKLSNNDYCIEFSENSHKIAIKGTMRLPGHVYRESISPEILTFTEKIATDIELDLSELEYLNSSGISCISMYLTAIKDTEQAVTIVGNRNFSWQSMSIENFNLCNENVKIIMQ